MSQSERACGSLYLWISPFAALKAQILIPTETKQWRLETMALSGLTHHGIHHRADPGALRSGTGFLHAFDLALCWIGHGRFQKDIQTCEVFAYLQKTATPI